jgi:photosystem II stability/assembly factor-like uncharacterized protein
MRFSLCILTLLFVSQLGYGQWAKQSVDTTAGFRGLSVVNEKVIWASGTGGTVIHTANGGKTWDVIAVPEASKLDFRDIEAFDANTAYILSIGNGDSSRIYKTTDGGKTWKLQFKNTDPKAFYDAIACWDSDNCIAMGDPVGGKYTLINTKDGGANWRPMDTDKMAAAKDGEAAFAASGTCLITVGTHIAYLVSGGKDARVFRTLNRGLTWFVADTPIISGTAGSGIFSIAMENPKRGIIVGGDYEKPDATSHTLALSIDGGERWTAGSGLNGYRSGVAYVDSKIVVAVGTNGSDISTDRGKTWRSLDKENYNAVAAKGKDAIWAVGPKGLVSRLTIK